MSGFRDGCDTPHMIELNNKSTIEKIDDMSNVNILKIKRFCEVSKS